MKFLEKAKLQRQREAGVVWDWGWKQGLTTNRHEGLFEGDSILKLDSGDGCTTVYIC